MVRELWEIVFASKDLQAKIYAQELHIFETKEAFLDVETANLHKVYRHADCTWKLDLAPFIHENSI